MGERNWATEGDEELVSRTKQGDRHAFEELARRHQSSCFKTAMAILRDQHAVEDEVQNSLCNAFQHIHQFNGQAKFSTWLTRIVVNHCLMRIRRERRASFLFLDDFQMGDETATMELPADIESPEQQLAAKQISDVLNREVHRIPPLLRNVFLLRDVQQLPMPEVAVRLGISGAAAKSRLLRARLELRRRLERYQTRMGVASLVAS